MTKPHYLFIQLAVVLAILTLLLVYPINVYAQTYSLEVSKNVVMPGEKFNITVCSESPYDTLLLFITGPGDEAINLTIVRVYRGDAVSTKGIIVVTVDEESKAVFEVEAPEKPGEYVLDLATVIGETVASTTFTVVGGAKTKAMLDSTVASMYTIAAMLLIIAVIAIIYWLWRHL